MMLISVALFLFISISIAFYSQTLVDTLFYSIFPLSILSQAFIIHIIHFIAQSNVILI